MSVFPIEFQDGTFPEINGTVEFRGLTYIFFEQFTLPTPEQLKLVPSTLPEWSLITWGWWNGEADIADQDIADITLDGDSLEDLSENETESALQNFNLTADGLAGEERELQPIIAAKSLKNIFDEQAHWGLVAISCPNWMTVAACEWLGCMNVAEPDEMALVLKKWHANWGVTALAFGGEEDDADLLLRIPAAHAEDPQMLRAFAVAADQVTTHKDEKLGYLASLWFD